MPKITLTQNEIVAAITKSVGDMGFQTQGKIITVELTAGRKNNGHTAEVSIEDAPQVVYPVEASKGCAALEVPEVVVTTVAETVVNVPVEELPVAEEVATVEEPLGHATVATDDLFDEA